MLLPSCLKSGAADEIERAAGWPRLLFLFGSISDTLIHECPDEGYHWALS